MNINIRDTSGKEHDEAQKKVSEFGEKHKDFISSIHTQIREYAKKNVLPPHDLILLDSIIHQTNLLSFSFSLGEFFEKYGLFKQENDKHPNSKEPTKEKDNLDYIN